MTAQEFQLHDKAGLKIAGRYGGKYEWEGEIQNWLTYARLCSEALRNSIPKSNLIKLTI